MSVSISMQFILRCMLWYQCSWSCDVCFDINAICLATYFRISAVDLVMYVSISTQFTVSCDVCFDIIEFILRCMFRYHWSLSCDVCFDINAIYLAMYALISMQLILRCMFRYQCHLSCDIFPYKCSWSCDVCFDINAVYSILRCMFRYHWIYLAMYVSISLKFILRCMFRYQCSWSCAVCFEINAVYPCLGGWGAIGHINFHLYSMPQKLDFEPHKTAMSIQNPSIFVWVFRVFLVSLVGGLWITVPSLWIKPSQPTTEPSRFFLTVACCACCSVRGSWPVNLLTWQRQLMGEIAPKQFGATLRMKKKMDSSIPHPSFLSFGLESVQLHSCEAVAGCPKTNRLLLALCQTALSRLSKKNCLSSSFLNHEFTWRYYPMQISFAQNVGWFI